MDSYVFAAGFPMPTDRVGIPCRLNLNVQEMEPVSARIFPCKIDVFGLVVHDHKTPLHVILCGAGDETVVHISAV